MDEGLQFRWTGGGYYVINGAGTLGEQFAGTRQYVGRGGQPGGDRGDGAVEGRALLGGVPPHAGSEFYRRDAERDRSKSRPESAEGVEVMRPSCAGE